MKTLGSLDTAAPGRGVSIAIAVLTASLIACACWLALLLMDFEDPNQSFWPFFVPPTVVTASSLLATAAGRPAPRWITGSILAGAAVFWLGLAILAAILLWVTYTQPA